MWSYNFKIKVVGTRENCASFCRSLSYAIVLKEEGTNRKYSVTLLLFSYFELIDEMQEASKQGLEFWACAIDNEYEKSLMKRNGIWCYPTFKFHFKKGRQLLSKHDFEIFEGLEIYVEEDDLKEYLIERKGMDKDSDEVRDIINEHLNNIRTLKSNN